MYKKLCVSTMASLKRLSVENDEELNQEVIQESYYYKSHVSNVNSCGSAESSEKSSTNVGVGLKPSYGYKIQKSPVASTSHAQAINITKDPNWQASCRTLRERNAAMWNNEIMSDIKFKVGNSPNVQCIPAHKYILATGSSVFFAMFYGGLSSCSPEIEIPDVEPVAFLNLLRYLYTDDIKLEADTVLTTLYAAKKYIVPNLAKKCVQYLETSLTAKNACILLSQSRLFEESDLMQRCWEVIDAQAEEAVKSEGFTEIDYKTLEAILERETLNISEVSLFHAVINWAESECARQDVQITPENQRKILGNILYKVRIPTMDLQEYADNAAQSKILTLQESHNLFLYFTARVKPKLPFETRPRRGLMPQTCLRFQSCAYRSNQWRYRGRCDSIQFSTDRRIFLAGFGLYGSSNCNAEYRVNMELKHNGVKLAHRSTKFISDGSSKIFPVYFDYPIQIEPEAYYAVSAVVEGSELSYFGQEGMAEVSVGRVMFQFQCSSDSTNGTGVQGGQIPQLIFYS